MAGAVAERLEAAPVQGASATVSVTESPLEGDSGPSFITSEEKASGHVPLAIYQRYAVACGGGGPLVGFFLLYLVTEGITLGSNLWLSVWSVGGVPSLNDKGYLQVFMLFVLYNIFGLLWRYVVGFHLTRRGARVLHSGMIRRLSVGTMQFFDSTPLGRLANRASGDVSAIDISLPMGWLYFLGYLFAMLSTIALIVVSQPLVILLLFPCGCLYYKIMNVYTSAVRESVRLGLLVKSPLLSLMNEVLSGRATLQAYGKEHEVMKRACKVLDILYGSAYMESICNRWLGIRVECMGHVITAFMATAAMVSRVRAGDSYGNASTVVNTLSLTLVMQMTGTLNWLVREAANTEADMNHVQRVVHYTDSVPQEDQPEMDSLIHEHLYHMQLIRQGAHPIQKPSTMLGATLEEHTPDTPAGTLEFQRVDLRYRDGLPLVLDGVSFRIRAGQKVGIVGRTGSGKSTLLLTFLRMVDICGGEILVNGRAIRSFSLRELRRQFAMIPQDPLLFEGTVQSNLDPFEESSSGEVWRALELVGMRERIESEAGGLEGRVLEGGSNFSVGQRQLLCLARALLKKQSGFILMDEATANIDPALDRQIQDTVASAFAAKTVITIAHRLHTVAQYDMIIVMDKGRVAEIGSPRELALNEASVFHSMLTATSDSVNFSVLDVMPDGAPSNENGFVDIG